MVKKGFYFLMVSLFYASLFAESQINLHCNAHSPVISLLNFLGKLAPFSKPLFLMEDKKPKVRTKG